MAEKPKLYYFNGRGKMESIRWLLATAGVEFEEEFIETREQYESLLRDGALLFQQVPMVDIDGMKLVQAKAILQYIAAKHDLYGKDLKEKALIDMYVEGTTDLMEIVMSHPFLKPEDKEHHIEVIVQKAKNRYFPVYEKDFKERISEIPTIKAFLQPGSQRKPQPDDTYVKTVKAVLQMYYKVGF
ncbi:glutathione S-transferase 3-like isoform 2-T2 [Rhinophrynus dorsalis]